jgi:RNA polymerase sigma factor (sigma-70 family)
MPTMPTDDAPIVAIVDDDAGVRDSLAMLLGAAGQATRAFASAEAFLRAPVETFGCVLVDLRLPGMRGDELQAEIVRRTAELPVIVITAHGDIASARAALLAGAIDFLEKPVNNDELLAAVTTALDRRGRAQLERCADARARSLLALLSPREREVFDRIVRGMHNREIALDLGISPRTVEVHRARLMGKLQARRLADLLRLRSQPAPGPDT